MKNFPNKFALMVLAVLCCIGQASATGFYGPREYLAAGGQTLVGTPEFYWELETKRLAKDFHPTEKPMLVLRGWSEGGEVDQSPLVKATDDADVSDFADALKTEAIKPPDAAKATQQNKDARTFVATATGTTTGTLPEEFDSEFADYHRGAYAFHLGKEHWDEARKAWEALLNRPAGERHYRSVWAAFMLGKLALKKGDADAAKWFQKVRELAKEGYADSLGMAADSYGWEGRSEWKLNHPEKAARLFLTQLALGDESAIVSLKALVPDRDSVDGMLNYGPDPVDGQNSNSAPAMADPKTLESLKTAAADPLLRRLVTAHILATGSVGSQWNAAQGANPRSARWLKVVSDAKPGPMGDAEYLGWLAYLNGDYKDAQHWLELAKADSPAAEWLRAKLQLRDGKVEDAEKSLGQAIDTLRDPSKYTAWSAPAGQSANTGGDIYVSTPDGSSWSMAESASGDLGQLHLERGDFVQAMDILLKGGLWEDAAFVAERILTADELKAYVDKLPATAPVTKMAPDGPVGATDDGEKLRYLLGRRLVREDRYAEAENYLPAPANKVLQKYTQALNDGANDKLSKAQRAQAWSTAAWLARFDGLELMGTEVAPDGFVSDGDFPNTDVAQQLIEGHHTENDNEVGQDKNVTVKNAIVVSKDELHRLETNKISPDVRYHYRMIGAALAMKAAALMDDETEELADLINTAGLWVKELDGKTGNRYYNVLEKRCSQTTLGRKVLAKHWFVDETGPWNAKQQATYDAIHKECGDPRTNAE